MKIEVAYAKPEEQLIIEVNVPDLCSIERAIELSEIMLRFPEIDLSKNKVGIFSDVCALSVKLQANDRIEIYRSLLLDPMDARRQRAQKQGR